MWLEHIVFPILCISFFYAGILAFRWGLAKMRHVQDTPTSYIRSAAQGYVELKGVLKQMQEQPLLEAALTRTPCLWWRYKIERYEASGNKSGSGRWVLIESDSSENSEHRLCLVDETGQCQINPEGADITGHTTKNWRGRMRDPRKLDQRNALSKLFSSSYRYSESVLLPEQPLYALGDFKSKRGQHLLEKPGDGRPFILSGTGEAKVIANGRLNVMIGALFILVAALLAVLWFWMLL